MQADKSAESTVDHLNSFLRGELSAVETYRLALQKLDRFAYRSTLEQCERSHEQRVRVLAEELRRRGAEPAQSSGAWGTLVKLIEGGATALGEKATVAVLEQGEDHGRDDYKRDLDDLDPAGRQLVELQILPEQYRTHEAMSHLKRTLS